MTLLPIKYNSNGDSLWVKRYNGNSNENDESYSIDIDDSNNVYICGRSKSTGATWNYVTIKYNQNGIEQWNVSYNGPPNNGEDTPFIVRVDKQRNVYVSGISDRGGFLYDYTTIKYSQPVGIEPVSYNVPDKFSLEQNYPNPFNPVTNIQYELPQNSFVKLLVYDIIGNQITSLVSSYQKAGVYKVNFDASQFSSGIYFYKLWADNFTETKKMVLVK